MPITYFWNLCTVAQSELWHAMRWKNSWCVQPFWHNAQAWVQ